MIYNKKIKAFTLSEVLIVLVITAIVVGIAFSILTLVTRQHNAIGDRYTYKSEILKLKQRLLLDFNSAKTVTWDLDQEQLIIVKPAETISYKWDNNNFIRNTDTIPLAITDILLLRAGLPVQSGTIDGLKLTSTARGVATHIFISRELDALSNLNEIWE